MKTTYEALYGEYERAIDVQNSVIAKNNKRLTTARKKNDFKEIKRIYSLLLVLYEERNELIERANGLKQYIS